MAPLHPVFALHGGGTTPAIWAPVRAAAPDLPLRTPDLNELAEALPREAGWDALEAALATRCPAGELILAGVGLGARMAACLAARLGTRVRGLLLLAPGAVFEDDAFRARVQGLRRYWIDGFSEQALPFLVATMLHRFGPRAASAAEELRAILRQGCGRGGEALGAVACTFGVPLQDRLPQVRCPIEVRYGIADPSFDRAWAAQWRRLPQVRFVRSETGGHQLPLELPALVAADLRRLAAG